MINKELLFAKREDIIKQRDNAFALHLQAIGALSLVDHLLELASKNDPGLTLDELAEAIGAESAEISPIGNNGG